MNFLLSFNFKISQIEYYGNLELMRMIVAIRVSVCIMDAQI
jgi:hypothetical protein